MRGLKSMTSLTIVAAGHAFVQNLRARPLRAHRQSVCPRSSLVRVHRGRRLPL